jgi:hypothetical protein
MAASEPIKPFLQLMQRGEIILCSMQDDKHTEAVK